METYLGIDVGSVTTKLAVLDKNEELITSLYLLTQGKPIDMVQQGLKQLKQQLPEGVEIDGVANEILVKDILTECIKGTPELKGKKKSDGLMMLLKNMLKGFVKQKMKLW